MKRILLALTLILTMSWTPFLMAATYRSGLGFSIVLPSGWKVIGWEELNADPSLLDSAFGSARKGALKTTDKDVVEQLKAMVLAGKLEYFLNKSYPKAIISVNGGNGKIPQTPEEMRITCESLPGDISKLIGKPTKVYECELRRMGNVKAIYTVADGFSEGSKSLQYQIQKNPEEILLLTATCQAGGCKEVSKEFDAMVNSIKLR